MWPPSYTSKAFKYALIFKVCLHNDVDNEPFFDIDFDFWTILVPISESITHENGMTLYSPKLSFAAFNFGHSIGNHFGRSSVIIGVGAWSEPPKLN